jgi:hypothetical protein
MKSIRTPQKKSYYYPVSTNLNMYTSACRTNPQGQNALRTATRDQEGTKGFRGAFHNTITLSKSTEK